LYFNNVTIFKIYNYLNINDLFNCSLINKQFNNIFNCDLLWKNIITEKYSDINIDEIQKQYNIINFKYICKKITDLLYLNKTLNLNKTVTDLINLQKLSLSNNQLKEIPKEIGSLINLQCLFLHNNQLKEIPREIGYLINLQVINKN
jgi:Leucine-rich repeat (LRR) protein